jgi:hypothetical protein
MPKKQVVRKLSDGTVYSSAYIQNFSSLGAEMTKKSVADGRTDGQTDGRQH